jgi:hypothetical protein
VRFLATASPSGQAGKKPDNRRRSGLKTTNSEEGLLESPYQAARVLVCQALSDLGH